MLQLILAPSRGWEDISSSTQDPEGVVRHLMYPMMVLAALSVFVRMFYDMDLKLTTVIVNAMVVFVSLFLTYFFALMMFSSFLYKCCEHEPTIRKMMFVLAYCMSLMALATITCNLLPVKLGLTYLLPLGVALVLWKANVYLTVKPEMDLFYIFFGVFCAILPPIVIQQLFESVI